MKLVFLRILTLRSLLTSIRVRTHCKRHLAGQHVGGGNAILTNSKKINQAAVLTAPKLCPSDCGSGEYHTKCHPEYGRSTFSKIVGTPIYHTA